MFTQTLEDAMARAFLFVLDSFGIGGAPDAALRNDGLIAPAISDRPPPSDATPK